MDTDDGDQQIAEVNLTPDDPNNPRMWRSDKPLVLHNGNQGEIKASGSVFQAVKSLLNAKMDWMTGGGKITAHFDLPNGATIDSSTNTQTGGVVLQSFGGREELIVSVGMVFVGRVSNPDWNILIPFKYMGYQMLRDYHAKRDKTVQEYVKGRQIWYSNSHGSFDGVPEGGPSGGMTWANYPFDGLCFYDSRFKIAADDLLSISGSGHDYRLVIVNACGSAQTSTNSMQDAKAKSQLLPGAKQFADAFGSRVAYIGWAWEVHPYDSEDWASEFVYKLVGGAGVEDAYEDFISAHGTEDGPNLMKLYDKGGNQPVDLKNKLL